MAQARQPLDKLTHRQISLTHQVMRVRMIDQRLHMRISTATVQVFGYFK